MVELLSTIEIYQFHVWLREITPLIWRRLLVRRDSTIAGLHYTLQIVMGCDDAHLHRFRIRGKDYGAKRANTSFTYLGSYADSRMACQLIEWQLPRGLENMKPFSGDV